MTAAEAKGAVLLAEDGGQFVPRGRSGPPRRSCLWARWAAVYLVLGTCVLGASPAVESIRMLDRKNGWAQSTAAIFKTTNGGETWETVLEADSMGIADICFDSLTSAWAVFAGDDTTQVSILRTADGGATWTRANLAQGEPVEWASLSLSSPDTGWLILVPLHGSSSSPGDLYRTRDGGSSWQRVRSTSERPRDGYDDYAPSELARPQSWLFCGGEVGFRNAADGWLVGNFVSTGPFCLFATHDGGRRWELQRLPLPASFQSGRVEPRGLPKFFPSGGNDGIIVTELSEADMVVYATRDGGRHWRPTTPVREGAVSEFISARQGWAWSPEPHDSDYAGPVKGVLYRTENGGLSWRPVRAQNGLDKFLTHGEEVTQLDFVDSEYGWALVRVGEQRGAPSSLLKTTDGGETWHALRFFPERESTSG